MLKNTSVSSIAILFTVAILAVAIDDLIGFD